jgi:hypothetical protein
VLVQLVFELVPTLELLELLAPALALVLVQQLVQLVRQLVELVQQVPELVLPLDLLVSFDFDRPLKYHLLYFKILPKIIITKNVCGKQEAYCICPCTGA